MAKSFQAQISDIVQKNQKKLLAIGKDAAIEVFEEAQRPVAKGGRMRVDTGFLRASGQANLNGLPTGPSKQGEPPLPPNVDLIVGQAKLGDHIFFGWTAEYASIREVYDGFLINAAGNWQKHVDAAVRKYSKR